MIAIKFGSASFRLFDFQTGTQIHAVENLLQFLHKIVS